ncbi:MAG TPA: hypothetical protein DDX71_04260 [Ruminococcus sp.]|nr:hypothetical protein [Ruminococcus sp.]
MSVQKIKTECPYCGGSEFVHGVDNGMLLQHPKHPFGPRRNVHCQICKRCGTIVRKFIVNPQELPDYDR